MNLIRKRIFLLIIVLLYVPVLVSAQPVPKNTVAVLPFVEGRDIHIQGAGKIIADWFLHELFKITTDYVVERIDLSEVMQEQSLQQSGVIDTGAAVKIGKIFGAKYLVVGAIEKWNREYSVTAKLLSTKTGIIIHSENFIIEDLNRLPHQLPRIAKNISDAMGTVLHIKKVSSIKDEAFRTARILAVIPFNARNDVGVKEAGSIVADWFVSELANLNRDQIVERMDLNKILSEQSLQLTGIIDENTAVRLGKIKGANYLVLGSIERWLEKVSVTAKLVDVEKGVIVRSEKFMADNMNEVPKLIPSISRLLTLTIEDRKKEIEELEIRQTRLSVSASIDIGKIIDISKTREVKTEFSLLIDDKLIVRKTLLMRGDPVVFPNLLNSSLSPGKHKISCVLSLKYLQDEVATFNVGSLRLPHLRHGQVVYKTVEKELYIDESEKFDAYINYSKDIKIVVYIKKTTDHLITGKTWYSPQIEIRHGALLDEYRVIIQRTIPHAEESFIKYVYKKAQSKNKFTITDYKFMKQYKVNVLPDGLISISPL